MANVQITKEKEFSWDITVYAENRPVKKAWAMNRDQAIGKADVLADYYRDENGQVSTIVINE